MKDRYNYLVVAFVGLSILLVILLSFKPTQVESNCPEVGEVVVDSFTQDSVMVVKTTYSKIKVRTPNHQFIIFNCEDLQ